MAFDVDFDQYRADGYLLLPQFFATGEIEAIRNAASNVFIAQMLARGIIADESPNEAVFTDGMERLFLEHLDVFINCGKQAQHLICLHQLSLDSRIMELLSKVGIGIPQISTRPVLFFNSKRLAKKEVYWRVFAHQDWRSMQGSLDAVVIWIPLADIDANLGTLEIVPGSHLAGLLTTEVVEGFGKTDAFPESAFRSVDVRQGDALLFSAFLVHRSGTNSTDRIRWSCHFRYNNLAERTFIERGYPHPYIYKPSDELLTPGFPATSQVMAAFAN